MQDDLSQRDLSGKRVQDMTPAERQEMKRRFEEFVGAMKRSGTPASERPKIQAKRWDPRAFGAKTIASRQG
jgi:hypothetical protein